MDDAAKMKLLSMKDVEKMLGVSHAFLYTRILASGELLTIKIGGRRFVRQSTLDAYLTKLEATNE